MKQRLLTRFLRGALKKNVKEESGYQQARGRQLALMEKGFNLGTKGKITVTRVELHARK